MAETTVDVFVIGGGAIGAAVARDAVGRGLSVVLAEAGDFGGGASGHAPGLLHGNPVNLARWQCRSVGEARREAAGFLVTAPHLARLQRLLLPVRQGVGRPPMRLQAGLWLYDRVSRGCGLPRHGMLDETALAETTCLAREGLDSVLTYYDVVADGRRLVLETLLDARDRGARIANYTRVTALKPLAEGFEVAYSDADGTQDRVKARYVVNATGARVNNVLRLVRGGAAGRQMDVWRGAYILLPMPDPPREEAVVLQAADGRFVFAVPWYGRHIAVGTTAGRHTGGEPTTAPTEAEKDRLLAACNRFLVPAAEKAHILDAGVGLRGAPATRGRTPPEPGMPVLASQRQGHGGLVSVYGGSLTTNRLAAARILGVLGEWGCRMGPSWTAAVPLHGGAAAMDDLLELAEAQSPVSRLTRYRWVETYGAKVYDMDAALNGRPGLAREVIPGVPEVELVHAVEEEEVTCAEDFLDRRTRLGMVIAEEHRTTIANWFTKRARAEKRRMKKG